MVLEEAWSGRKHNVTQMRVFGCVVYAHVSDELRKKLDIKGDNCIFLDIVMNPRSISSTIH